MSVMTFASRRLCKLYRPYKRSPAVTVARVTEKAAKAAHIAAKPMTR